MTIYLLDHVIAAAIQLSTAQPVVEPTETVVPATPTAAIRYEKSIAKFTPAEVQKSFILQSVQSASQRVIREREVEQRELLGTLPPEEQVRLQQSVTQQQVGEAK